MSIDDAGIVVVRAPAGSGKTTLLAHWATVDRARDFAFLGPRVIGLLLPKLYSEDEDDRTKGVLILRETTGLTQGFDPTSPPAAREAAADQWTSWYLTNRSKLALDRKARRIR